MPQILGLSMDPCILDVDECHNDTLHNCHVDATCNDTVGSFICECNEGYQGNGVECQSEITTSVGYYTD